MQKCEELSYGDDPLQRVDVYREEGAAEYLLLFLHGGLWISGDKSEYVSLAAELAREGWAMAVANYRLSGGGVMAPAHTQDAGQCLALLAGLLRPRRYLLVGHSCGAHMAALLLEDAPLMAACGGPPAAVVTVQGIFSLAAFCRDFPEWRAEVERSQGPDERAWRDPRGGGGTEWLLIHSPEDPWVNAGQSEGWLRQLPPGTPARLVADVGGAHFAAVRAGEQPHRAQLLRELRAVMAAAEEPLAQRDERRRQAAAGFREGRAAGTEAAAQVSDWFLFCGCFSKNAGQSEFSRGFAAGAAEAAAAGRALGLLHTREQLTGREEPRRELLIHRLEEGEMSPQELEQIMGEKK